MKIKSVLKTVLFGVAMFTLTSCAKETNPTNYTKNQLIFGSGGGFANQVNEYRLLDNRRLYFRKNNDSTFTSLGKQKGRTVKQIFANSEVLFQEIESFNEPGNMYYFVRLQKDKHTQSVVWGRPNTEAPEKARTLHKQLMNLVLLK